MLHLMMTFSLFVLNVVIRRSFWQRIFAEKELRKMMKRNRYAAKGWVALGMILVISQCTEPPKDERIILDNDPGSLSAG